MEPPVLLSRVEDGTIAIITLNRPKSLNAISKELGLQLGAALRGLLNDDKVRVAIITGAGRAFCAGVDLKDPLFADSQYMREEFFRSETEPYYLKALQMAKFPVIAAINGVCSTGGLEIALNCDILLAASTAVLFDHHTTYGIPPAGGMSQILPRLVGPQRAKMMSLSGMKLPAATAEAWGLVAKVVPAEELMEQALQLARNICGKNQGVNRMFKHLIDRGQSLGLADAMELELSTALSHYVGWGQRGQDTKQRLSKMFGQRQRAQSKL